MGLSECSVAAYTNAFGKILDEMQQKGTIRKPLENMSLFELDLAISHHKRYRFYHKRPTRKTNVQQYRFFNTTAEDSGGHAYMAEIENGGQIPETEKRLLFNHGSAKVYLENLLSINIMGVA